MTDKTIEERIERLEKHAHNHKFFGRGSIFGDAPLKSVEEEETTESIKREIEKLQMSLSDIEKAKKKGTVHGDPIIVIE